MKSEVDIYSDVDTVIARFAKGEFVVLGGDPFRGGDIDLVTSAALITPEKINFLATKARGLICLGMESEAASRLGIMPVNPGDYRQSGRPFGTSFEASEGVTTGISAADRSKSIQAAIAEGANASSIVKPGHVFPLFATAKPDETERRAADAAVELARRAGEVPFAVLCSVLLADGEPARMSDMPEFMEEFGIVAGHISQL